VIRIFLEGMFCVNPPHLMVRLGLVVGVRVSSVLPTSQVQLEPAGPVSEERRPSLRFSLRA
jgi:hypothetical protein